MFLRVQARRNYSADKLFNSQFSGSPVLFRTSDLQFFLVCFLQQSQMQSRHPRKQIIQIFCFVKDSTFERNGQRKYEWILILQRFVWYAFRISKVRQVLKETNEPTKGFIPSEGCVINFVSDAPSSRETTAFCPHRYNY